MSDLSLALLIFGLAYLLIITLTLGGMLLHNLLIWRRKLLARRDREPRTVVRMTPRQRLQHAALLVSFFFLALSGFALKYPDSWLAWVLGLASSTTEASWPRQAARIASALFASHSRSARACSSSPSLNLGSNHLPS